MLLTSGRQLFASINCLICSFLAASSVLWSIMGPVSTFRYTSTGYFELGVFVVTILIGYVSISSILGRKWREVDMGG